MVRQSKSARPEFVWADALGLSFAILSLLLASVTLLIAKQNVADQSFMGPVTATHQILMFSSVVVGAVAFGTSLLDHKVRALSFAGMVAVLVQFIGLTSGARCCSNLVALVNSPDAVAFADITAWGNAILPFAGNLALAILYPRNWRARLAAWNHS